MPNGERKERSNGHAVQYKEAFSLRDELGTCSNIEIEIHVTDKSPFLLGLAM